MFMIKIFLFLIIVIFIMGFLTHPLIRRKIKNIHRKVKIRIFLIVVFFLIIAACIFIYINFLMEKKVKTIQLPSGDKIIIAYKIGPDLLSILVGAGGLKYYIISEKYEKEGMLTGSISYDVIDYVELSYDIVDNNMIKIREKSYEKEWLFSLSKEGGYEITDLSKKAE